MFECIQNEIVPVSFWGTIMRSYIISQSESKWLQETQKLQLFFIFRPRNNFIPTKNATKMQKFLWIMQLLCKSSYEKCCGSSSRRNKKLQCSLILHLENKRVFKRDLTFQRTTQISVVLNSLLYFRKLYFYCFTFYIFKFNCHIF